MTLEERVASLEAAIKDIYKKISGYTPGNAWNDGGAWKYANKNTPCRNLKCGWDIVKGEKIWVVNSEQKYCEHCPQ